MSQEQDQPKHDIETASKISELKDTRDDFILSMHLGMTFMVSLHVAATSFLGLAAYEMITKQSLIQFFMETAISLQIAAGHNVCYSLYKNARHYAREFDCDIYEENGGEIIDCRFQKYVLSQFIIDDEPS